VLEKYTRETLTNSNDIVDTVRQAGLIIVREYLSANELSDLRREFQTIIETRHHLDFDVDERDYITNVRMRKDDSAKAFPQIVRTFSNALMHEVASAYMGEDKGKLNDLIFVNEIKTTPPDLDVAPFVLHFDKLRVLKFFIYLDDTTASNGAMWVAPTSMIRNQRHRARIARLGGELSENRVSELEQEIFPIEAPAGSLIVFDTDMSHKAGAVNAGQVRRAMRGHTYFKAQHGALTTLTRTY
jgi:ectoine hydroxylase-related dioxygenase (phytanoyl-CoA dioxygenase family)